MEQLTKRVNSDSNGSVAMSDFMTKLIAQVTTAWCVSSCCNTLCCEPSQSDCKRQGMVGASDNTPCRCTSPNSTDALMQIFTAALHCLAPSGPALHT